MFLTQSLLCLLSIVCYAAATAIPQVSTDALVAGDADQTINTTNNTTGFQPPHILLHCGNQYRNLARQGNNLQSVSSFEYFIGTLIKRRSDENNCGRTSGTRGGGSDVNWEYEARTSGGDCRTSANDGQIRDSIRGALRYMTDSGVDHACVRLDNCGTWKGYLQIADHRKNIQHGQCAVAFNV